MSALRRRDLLLGAFKQLRTPQASTTPSVIPLVAKIQSFDCLSRGSQVCTICIERCPVPGAVVRNGTRVRIVDAVCTGCGLCQDVCPAPTPAIVMWPRDAAADLASKAR